MTGAAELRIGIFPSAQVRQTHEVEERTTQTLPMEFRFGTHIFPFGRRAFRVHLRSRLPGRLKDDGLRRPPLLVRSSPLWGRTSKEGQVATSGLLKGRPLYFSLRSLLDCRSTLEGVPTDRAGVPSTRVGRCPARSCTGSLNPRSYTTSRRPGRSLISSRQRPIYAVSGIGGAGGLLAPEDKVFGGTPGPLAFGAIGRIG